MPELLTYQDQDFYYHDGVWWAITSDGNGTHGVELESPPWVLH